MSYTQLAIGTVITFLPAAVGFFILVGLIGRAILRPTLPRFRFFPRLKTGTSTKGPR